MTTPRTDPFRPVGGGPAAFPDRRLRRAGVDADTVGRLRGEWAGMSGEERGELSRFVAQHPDQTLRARFVGRLSREEAEALHVDDLRDRLRERPGGLSTAGRKAELVDRLVASFEDPTAATGPTAVAASAPQSDDGGTPAPETADAPAAPADGTDAPATGTPAAAPTETPDAAPAPATEEDTDRG